MKDRQGCFEITLGGVELGFCPRISAADSTRIPRASGVAPFVAGEISVRSTGAKLVIVDEFNAGNLLELCRALRKRLIALPESRLMPGLVQPGGWCSWMHQYWVRIDRDRATAEDELNYDLLSALSFVEGRGGRIGLYKFANHCFIEAGAPAYPVPDREPVVLCSRFDQPTAVDQVNSLEAWLRQLAD